MRDAEKYRKIKALFDCWRRPEYRDVMLPGSPLLTCSEVAAELRGPSSFAVLDVVDERFRQIYEEEFSVDRDDTYVHGELAWAGATYAVATLEGNPASAVVSQETLAHQLWPWALNWFKPKDRRRDLVRAAALIIAEIERLDRAEKP